MKILLVIDTFWPKVDGAAVFTQRLGKRLRQRGHEVLVVAPSRTWRLERFEHDNVPVCGIPSIPVLRYPLRVCPAWYSRRAVIRAIDEFKPDIIHMQHHFLLGKMAVRAAVERGIPVVGTNHFMPENLVHYFPVPFLRPALAEFLWRGFRRVFKNVRAVTTPTHAAAALLARAGLKQPVQVVSNGIDLEQFHPGPDAGGTRKKFKLPDGPLLLFVGRVDAEKNLDRVLNALPAALAQAKFHFAVAGKGQEQVRLERQVRRLGIGGSVTFTGFIENEELPGLYRAADCFIMAGTAELQSIATMEAMASGLPVIAADAVALPELVRNGENGYLFAPEDIKDLSGALSRMFGDEARRREMGQKSLEIIREHDINKIVDRFVAIYQEVLGASKPK